MFQKDIKLWLFKDIDNFKVKIRNISQTKAIYHYTTLRTIMTKKKLHEGYANIYNSFILYCAVVTVADFKLAL